MTAIRSDATSIPSRRVKVALLIGSLAVGGAETQLVRLANHLDRTRYSPSIVCMWEGGDLERVVAADVPVIRAMLPRQRYLGPGRRIVLGTRTVSALVRLLRAQRPDVVHAYLPAAYVLSGLVAWALRVPVIMASRRGLTSYETLGLGAWLGRMANRVIDMQICNSRAVQDWAVRREHLSRDKTRIIHNGIDLPDITGSVSIPQAWKSDGPRAASVANFIGYKGHRELLRAVALVKQSHPSFRLVLVGDGPERGVLEDLVRELDIAGYVIFAGRRPDAAELMRAFDFTILGSSEEGFPNALMESMARAVPVVATDVGGVRELVTDGVHGRLVPYGDVAAMAAAINWMIERRDERKAMGERCRARIAAEFSTERMVSATEAVYDELLSKVGFAAHLGSTR